MSEDKHKNIPVLDNIIQSGRAQPAAAKKNSANSKIQSPPVAKRSTGDRRQLDRRKAQTTPVANKPERRVAEQRVEPRRTSDQRRNTEIDQLAEKIMQDMMPDLEQHLFMQLRFELQKYIPKILSEFKDKDKE
ncbi:MAG: hypothetical protein OEY06_00615 [Gammaproteobacteria bacterium]|nr:hypothetical protein [Gammaproteobacteria bacterium]